MEDEHADRVYVPGTNPTPPDRDVEPFWAEDELEAPVHGRPVPHEALPAIPLPPPQGGVYRPVDRPGANPQHPGSQQPIPHQPAFPPIPLPPPATAAQPAPPPTQAWPNIEPSANGLHDPSNGFAPAPVSGSAAVPGGAAALPGPGPEPSGGHARPVAAPTSGDAAMPVSGAEAAAGHSDSPWSQPPQRTGAAEPDGSGEARATASVSVPGAARPGYYPTVTPRGASDDVSPEGAHNGAIYRPEASAPAANSGSASGPIYRPGSSAAPTSGSAHGAAQVPPPAGPRPTSAQPAAPHPTSAQPAGPRPANVQSAAPEMPPAQRVPPQGGQPPSGLSQPGYPQAGPYPSPPGATQSGGTPPGATHAGPGLPGAAQPGAAQPGVVQPGATRPGAGLHGVAQRGVVPPQPAPPGTPQPHPAPPGTSGPYGAPPQTPYGAPPQQPGQQPGQRPPGQPMPGPYPPTVDPRALPPHPQINQGGTTAPPQPPPGPTGPGTDPFQDLPWVSDGTPTAEEFARRRMAKQAEPTATMGARALLRKGTMGLVKLAPGRHEVEFKQDVDMVRRNFGGLRQVTVVNPKGGAGKTIAVLLLAMTFGQKRGGYVLAWDNNETQGTLGMRAQQDFNARTVRDMMRDLHLFRGAHGGRVGDLSQYVRAQGEGMFDVLASDESATAGEMLTASAFAEIREIVSRFYKLIFVDTGNNVRAQNWQAAMDATDQLVITMSARNDSAETAARMLDHLEQSGRQRLVRQAVSIVSMPPTRKDIDLPAIQRHFAARTRAVLMAPYEKLIDSGEPLRYGQLSANTKDAWLKIAAAVAEGL